MPAINWYFPVLSPSAVAVSQVPAAHLAPRSGAGALLFSLHSAVPHKLRMALASHRHRELCNRRLLVCPDEMPSLKFVMPASHLFKSENVYTKDCGLID